MSLRNKSKLVEILFRMCSLCLWVGLDRSLSTCLRRCWRLFRLLLRISPCIWSDYLNSFIEKIQTTQHNIQLIKMYGFYDSGGRSNEAQFDDSQPTRLLDSIHTCQVYSSWQSSPPRFCCLRESLWNVWCVIRWVFPGDSMPQAKWAIIPWDDRRKREEELMELVLGTDPQCVFWWLSWFCLCRWVLQVKNLRNRWYIVCLVFFF